MAIEQKQDTYTWQATLKDGTVVNEPDVDTFTYIDKDLAASIALLASGSIVHQVAIPEGAEPVFFRRRTMTLSLADGQPQHDTTHCIGWRREDRGVYLFVRDDGSTLLSSDLQAV